jgi:hypothetical protein
LNTQQPAGFPLSGQTWGNVIIVAMREP